MPVTIRRASEEHCKDIKLSSTRESCALHDVEILDGCVGVKMGAGGGRMRTDLPADPERGLCGLAWHVNYAWSILKACLSVSASFLVIADGFRVVGGG